MRIDKEVEQLKGEVLEMAKNARSSFEAAIKALKRMDFDLAQKLPEMDRELNRQEIKLDSMCIRLLALNDPYGPDFRFIFSVVKTTRDLERVGDESKNIAQWCQKLSGEPTGEMLTLADKSMESFETAVESLISMDASLAEKVIAMDRDVDRLEDEVIAQSPSLAVGFVAKALERIGDLSANIAENVIFSVKAEDVRHMAKRMKKEGADLGTL